LDAQLLESRLVDSTSSNETARNRQVARFFSA
jgi:hypothetical protein